jgi:dTDP-glucose 4,6-dehydratase
LRKLLVTGGAGFIGSNFVYHWIKTHPSDQLTVLDALTYAGNISNIKNLIEKKQIQFVHGNICNKNLVSEILKTQNIDTIVHFAAESHVDRSIVEPEAFIQTNVNGTFTLLRSALETWKDQFAGKRFHHVSTDEVYGDLDFHDPAFTELTPYAPRSPYAASKASSDMLVRAYGTTYGLPVTISNCSNNYGPFHFPEKLIPLMVLNCLNGKPLPVYGKGENVRDWLYVDDHCRAIEAILLNGRTGQTYNVGGDAEVVNIDMVRRICYMIDNIFKEDPQLKTRFPNCPASLGAQCESLITYVKDRPGHDRRYAINHCKIASELGWQPQTELSVGLMATVQWFLNNEKWWASILSGEYKSWIDSHYGTIESELIGERSGH